MGQVRTASVVEPIKADPSAPHFLVHNEGDHVGVAVQDVDPGTARVLFMDSDRVANLVVSEKIPLGHKVALVKLAEGADILEYRVRVGITRTAIAAGQLVHMHNMRSARWQTSV